MGWPLEGVGVKTISWAPASISLKINLNSLNPLLFLIVYMPALVRSYPTHVEDFSFPGQFCGCILAWGIFKIEYIWRQIFDPRLLSFLDPRKLGPPNMKSKILSGWPPCSDWGLVGLWGVGWGWGALCSSRESAGRGGLRLRAEHLSEKQRCKN